MGVCYSSKSKNSRKYRLANEEKNDERINISKSNFIEDTLYHHNYYRSNHKSEPLVVNSELNELAQNWANEISKDNHFDHSKRIWKGKKIGENIAMCFGEKITGKFISDLWYNEIRNYDFNRGNLSSETNNFTQLIWRNTREIGVGIAQSNSGNWYAVVNYYPEGNISSEVELNVINKD